jgi:hypothetical protein
MWKFGVLLICLHCALSHAHVPTVKEPRIKVINEANVCPADLLLCIVKRGIQMEFFDAHIEDKYILFTKANRTGELISTNPSVINVTKNFNRTLPTKVIVHGYSSDSKSSTVMNIVNAYLDNHDVNVIALDWSAGSENLDYCIPRRRVSSVGVNLGQFLDNLLRHNSPMWKKLSIVGHSLGAHVAGFAGRTTRQGKVGTIVGLDPAGPSFHYNYVGGRLNINDADYVECIHTNWRCYGMKEAIGNVDFYVNGGYQQLGCDYYFGINICDHTRSAELFAESLGPNKFYGRMCENPIVKDVSKDFLSTCKHEVVVMGGEPGNGGVHLNGTYFVPTGTHSPYSKLN